MMRVALFVPCYVNQFYPGVAVATLELLEKLGVNVAYPLDQTCCGQPMANAGFQHTTSSTNELFIENFTGYDYIVSPSGSCVLHVKHHMNSESKQEEALAIRNSVYELTEFLKDILNITKLKARFPHQVGLHQSCHGQRGLMLSQMSEKMEPHFSKAEDLLKMVEGIQLIPLDRNDECCGFGGTFAVAEEAVSVKMGSDRILDHLTHGAEYITAGDMSCLMHLDGILRRKRSKTKVIHIAEILNAG